MRSCAASRLEGPASSFVGRPLFSAVAMLPLVALLSAVLGAPPALTLLSVVTGTAAALVQALGLVRWPFAVPELARQYIAAPDDAPGDAIRDTVKVVFGTLHRLVGVGIGEHLGYLLTGSWTLLIAASIYSATVLPAWLALVGVPIGVSLVVGSLEFAGRNERDGWSLAGAIVPIAYIGWSIWLIALGIFLLV